MRVLKKGSRVTVYEDYMENEKPVGTGTIIERVGGAFDGLEFPADAGCYVERNVKSITMSNFYKWELTEKQLAEFKEAIKQGEKSVRMEVIREMCPFYVILRYRLRLKSKVKWESPRIETRYIKTFSKFKPLHLPQEIDPEARKLEI